MKPTDNIQAFRAHTMRNVASNLRAIAKKLAKMEGDAVRKEAWRLESALVQVEVPTQPPCDNAHVAPGCERFPE